MDVLRGVTEGEYINKLEGGYLPGRIKAGSSRSGRLVAAMTRIRRSNHPRPPWVLSVL